MRQKISFLEYLSSTYMLGKEKRKKKKIKEEREKKLRRPIIEDYLAANLFGRQILYKLMLQLNSNQDIFDISKKNFSLYIKDTRFEIFPRRFVNRLLRFASWKNHLQ